MFKVRLHVRRYRKSPFGTNLIPRALDHAAMQYADMIEQMYLETVADWSTEHGTHRANPRRKGEEGTRINIYLRGKFAYIFALQDMGFMRKIAIIGGYDGRPKVGKHGTLATGRLLRDPVPVVAKKYTERIASAARLGDTALGSYREYMAYALSKTVYNARRTGHREVHE
jgi:hypothetical protein